MFKTTCIFISDDDVKQCKTRADDKRNPNTDCKFPFTFDGKEYNQCTDITINSKKYINICATERTEEFKIADWGYCSDECNKEGKTIELRIT